MSKDSSIALGKETYIIENSNCIGRSYLLDKSESISALSGPIFVAHHSVDELAYLKKELSALAHAGFEYDELEATLSSFNGMEPWRIGETFAECWLAEHRKCNFPWNTQHDIRSLKASLPGTDLVGITMVTGITSFAFGEVKTSSDEDSPPSLVYGNKGITFQIRNLYSSIPQRRQLIQNLGLRAIEKPWFDEYKKAVSSHLKGKYYYWGIMLRDTTPNPKDLEYTVSTIATCASNDAPAEFITLHTELPISEWPSHCNDGGTKT